MEAVLTNEVAGNFFGGERPAGLSEDNRPLVPGSMIQGDEVGNGHVRV